MSLWRRKASEILPELQSIISDKHVDNPMMLWIELNMEFDRLCEEQYPPLDLLSRIWTYCDWCMKHRCKDVQTAAALAFCEHLLDTSAKTAVLSRVISRGEFLTLRSLLEYHNSPSEVDQAMNQYWPQ